MIELKDAQAQMNRMIGLKFGPKGSQERVEVLRVMRTARTPSILEAGVTSWIDSQPDFPRPSEMRAILSGLNVIDDEEAGKATRGCVACGGSGWVEVRGISRFDGLEASGAKACLCRSTGQRVVDDRDACSRCGGRGIYGGQIGMGRFDGPWRWCECLAGQKRSAREPGLIDEANRARAVLTTPRGRKIIAQLEPYHGEF